MDDEKKFYMNLSIILVIISGLLLLRLLPNIFLWNISSSSFFIDLIGLIWPLIGISIAIEFLRSQRDKWGWGGFLFHIFILYCGIYYLILIIQSIIDFSVEISFIYNFVLYLAISGLGWFGFLYYYD